MGLAAIFETLYEREFMRTKLRLLVPALFLVLVIFLIYFFQRKEQPWVAFHSIDSPTFSSGANQLLWPIRFTNISHSKEIDGWYQFEKRGTNGKIAIEMPLVQSIEYELLPSASYDAGLVTSKNSQGEYRLVLYFTAQTQLEKKIYRRFVAEPRLQHFLPGSELHSATTEWFRVISLPLTNETRVSH